MPQKRKRKRTKIKPGPILVLALVVVLAAGIYTSKLTSVSKVSVEGARPADQASIDRVLAKLNGIPLIQLNPRWVETQVQRIQAVDRATYSQNIFGRGHLKVVYRVPVAKVKARQPIGLDASGVMFETDQLPDDLPVVIRPEGAKDLPVGVAAGFPAGSVAELAIKARRFAPKDKLIIWFKSGTLCLNMGTGLVILGSCDDLDAKLHSLKEILDEQPELLAKVESLNLTEPEHPVKTYKRQRE